MMREGTDVGAQATTTPTFHAAIATKAATVPVVDAAVLFHAVAQVRNVAGTCMGVTATLHPSTLKLMPSLCSAHLLTGAT